MTITVSRDCPLADLARARSVSAAPPPWIMAVSFECALAPQHSISVTVSYSSSRFSAPAGVHHHHDYPSRNSWLEPSFNYKPTSCCSAGCLIMFVLNQQHSKLHFHCARCLHGFCCFVACTALWSPGQLWACRAPLLNTHLLVPCCSSALLQGQACSTVGAFHLACCTTAVGRHLWDFRGLASPAQQVATTHMAVAGAFWLGAVGSKATGCAMGSASPCTGYDTVLQLPAVVLHVHSEVCNS